MEKNDDDKEDGDDEEVSKRMKVRREEKVRECVCTKERKRSNYDQREKEDDPKCRDQVIMTFRRLNPPFCGQQKMT